MRSCSDLCIPDGAHDFLRARGWGIVRARDFDLDNQPDENVWAFARRENRVLLSADFDFRRFRQFPLNGHPGCIVLNITRGLSSSETPTAFMIRILATALPHLPTHAGMHESKVYLDANSGSQVRRDSTRITLY
jgi:predicted nuclease of predicted toxin-antitoxin system